MISLNVTTRRLDVDLSDAKSRRVWGMDGPGAAVQDRRDGEVRRIVSSASTGAITG